VPEVLTAHSTGRYTLLLDDDTVLRAGTIGGMVHFMDAHPEKCWRFAFSCCTSKPLFSDSCRPR